MNTSQFAGACLIGALGAVAIVASGGAAIPALAGAAVGGSAVGGVVDLSLFQDTSDQVDEAGNAPSTISMMKSNAEWLLVGAAVATVVLVWKWGGHGRK